MPALSYLLHRSELQSSQLIVSEVLPLFWLVGGGFKELGFLSVNFQCFAYKPSMHCKCACNLRSYSHSWNTMLLPLAMDSWLVAINPELRLSGMSHLEKTCLFTTRWLSEYTSLHLSMVDIMYTVENKQRQMISCCTLSPSRGAYTEGVTCNVRG